MRTGVRVTPPVPTATALLSVSGFSYSLFAVLAKFFVVVVVGVLGSTLNLSTVFRITAV